MNQLGRSRGCSARQIVLFHQQNGQAAARRVASDAGAVDSTADDREVEDPVHGRSSGDSITVPVYGSTNTKWSCTACTPETFSTITQIARRSSGLVIVPQTSATPLVTVTFSVVIGAQD